MTKTNQSTRLKIMFRTAVAALAGLVLLTGTSFAKDVYLIAKSHTVTLPARDTTPALDLNALPVLPYGGTQDASCPAGGATVSLDGSTLSIQGNCWKKIDLGYTVTADTVLEFDFRSTAQGEIHGIGFDADDAIAQTQTFQLYGTQVWGIQDFHSYPAGADAQGWVHYSIPAGALATGGALSLTFANDHDSAPSNGTSHFRNIRITEPTGRTVLMWGYAIDEIDPATNKGACYQITPASARRVAPECLNPAASTPGPELRVDPADSSLRIFLTNLLPEYTSIVVPGQEMPYAPAGTTPVWNDGSSGDRLDYANLPDQPRRVRSFGREANPNGGRRNYVWNNSRNNPFKPGTFLYHSGTIPAKQVQMGLYGAAIRDADAGVAYQRTVGATTTPITYDQDIVLLYHEIDPVMHDAVESGAYGTPDFPSAFEYHPQYFLINGADYDPGTPGSQQTTGLPADGTTLIRFINAGLRTHAPTLQGLYMDVQAEDGNVFSYPARQYSYRLTAGQTMDATVRTSAASTTAIYDRMMGLTNPASNGGMVAFLSSPTPGAIDFYQHEILSYGGPSQDFCPPGGVTIEDGGSTLRIQGNCWKQIALAYPVSAITTIEFDFMSTEEADIHGIGFDTDNAIGTTQTFQVFGAQTWGIQTYNDYMLTDGWKHYAIAAGALTVGASDPQALTFTNDADGSPGSANGVSYFRNVRICEGACP